MDTVSDALIAEDKYKSRARTVVRVTETRLCSKQEWNAFAESCKATYLSSYGHVFSHWLRRRVRVFESAVGVLLYQMGISAIAVIIPAIALVRTAFGRAVKIRPGTARWAHPEPVDILFIAIAVILANGIFQEEAYSPYGLGLLTCLVQLR